MGTEMDERHLRLPAIGNVGGRVQGDRIPNDIGLCLRVSVTVQKMDRRVGTVDCEAFIGGMTF